MPDTGYVPPGTSAVTPYICVRRCSAAIDWYAEVFWNKDDWFVWVPAWHVA